MRGGRGLLHIAHWKEGEGGGGSGWLVFERAIERAAKGEKESADTHSGWFVR